MKKLSIFITKIELRTRNSNEIVKNTPIFLKKMLEIFDFFIFRFDDNQNKDTRIGRTMLWYQDDTDYEWKYKYSKICGIKNKS